MRSIKVASRADGEVRLIFDPARVSGPARR
jgi:hypothetical protein